MKGWVIAIIVITVALLLLLFIGVLLLVFMTPSSSPDPIPVPPTPIPPVTSPDTLRLQNNSNVDMWFVVTYGQCDIPYPGRSSTDILVPSSQKVDLPVPTTGLDDVKIYFKYGCDSTGSNCNVGNHQSYVSGGNTLPCAPTGPCQTNRNWCSLRTDNLLEFSFAALGKTSSYLSNNIEGVTVPYSLTINDTTCTSINAPNVDFNDCPLTADLSYNGITMENGVDLTKVNLRYSVGGIANNYTLGCMSPCSALTLTGTAPIAKSVYCCSGQTASQCAAGPAANNAYTQTVQKWVPNSYTYMTDNGPSYTCPSGGKIYTVTVYTPTTNVPRI
jgi:hypothetical protein